MDNNNPGWRTIDNIRRLGSAVGGVGAARSASHERSRAAELQEESMQMKRDQIAKEEANDQDEKLQKERNIEAMAAMAESIQKEAYEKDPMGALSARLKPYDAQIQEAVWAGDPDLAKTVWMSMNRTIDSWSNITQEQRLKKRWINDLQMAADAEDPEIKEAFTRRAGQREEDLDKMIKTGRASTGAAANMGGLEALAALRIFAWRNSPKNSPVPTDSDFELYEAYLSRQDKPEGFFNQTAANAARSGDAPQYMKDLKAKGDFRTQALNKLKGEKQRATILRGGGDPDRGGTSGDAGGLPVPKALVDAIRGTAAFKGNLQDISDSVLADVLKEISKVIFEVNGNPTYDFDPAELNRKLDLINRSRTK